MKITIGSDHGGFKLKEKIKKHLSDYEVEDVGCTNENGCDYPEFASKVAKKVQEEGIGILICGTGIGMSMAANKFKGIRAAVCFDEYTAKMAREHNNANILCIGERTTKEESAVKIVYTFLNTEASDEERHKRRVDDISKIEKNNFK